VAAAARLRPGRSAPRSDARGLKPEPAGPWFVIMMSTMKAFAT
jgi:hypothetical protein